MAQGSILTDAGAIDVSVPASADLSASQFLCIELNASGEAVVAGANEKVLGILQNKPSAQGETARVRIQGVSKAIVSETVAFAEYLTCTAAGELELVDAAAEEIAARALGGFVANDQAEVQLMFGKSEDATP